MAIKKSELYSSLWKSCDELRGGMDASQYKDYVLVLLFVKYVSDKYAKNPNALIEIPEGGGFADMIAAKGQKDIGESINKIIANLAEANDLKGVIDVADFNNDDKLGKGKDMVDRLTNLVAIFEHPALDFSKNRAEGDDILGDAYEYLMMHFATESGKSKGQFYTPAEVSRIIAKVIGINQSKSQDETLYDPTCGSGSLLLKAADEAPYGITIFGQEMDNATAALAKMNMILHKNPTAVIHQDNTLSKPHFINKYGGLETYDYVVANPPFSYKSWSNGVDAVNDEYERFKGYGIPPAKNGDYAFLLHLIRSLKSKGKGAIILPHGVLFRGNAEADIRKAIIRKGYIKGIIGLPANLFYGTGIPACIIVLDKENADSRRGIFMIDASKGFVKDGNKNRLREQDLHKIVDIFTKQIEFPKYSRMVTHAEIEDNEFNLNIPRYIDSQESEDIQDIAAHLLGGIPNRDIEALSDYWSVYPTLKDELFLPSERENYQVLRIEHNEIKTTIFSHGEFVSYSEKLNEVLATWQAKHTPYLKDMGIGTKPKEVVYRLAEDILQAFTDKKLIDKYDIYQNIMTYWAETMQDDVYMITADGWVANDELIPRSLIINRYFPDWQQYIEQLAADRDAITQAKEEMEEEHSGEEGILEEAKNDKGKIIKGEVQKRIKELKAETPIRMTILTELINVDYGEEVKTLKAYLKLIEKEAIANKKVKKVKETLLEKVFAKYRELTEDEIKTLVVNDKWMATIEQSVKSEMERISQNLTQRIKTLSERYKTPLPQLSNEVEDLTAKVNAHLNEMGFSFEPHSKAANIEM